MGGASRPTVLGGVTTAGLGVLSILSGRAFGLKASSDPSARAGDASVRNKATVRIALDISPLLGAFLKASISAVVMKARMIG
jgi:hypothetical protein